MAEHAVVIQNAVQAANIDALNRSVQSADDIDNGYVFNMYTMSSTSGEEEIWIASTPNSGIVNLWMAYEPEVVTIVSGSLQYKGINDDPRNFYNIAGNSFTAFKPMVGDIITITAAGLAGTKTTNTYVVATSGTYKLTWAAAAVTGLSLHLLETTYISIADGTIGTQRVTAYRFEVAAIA